MKTNNNEGAVDNDAKRRDDYERGYIGHGRGVVVTNDGRGNFSERPMTAGEMAAREPAWTIGADPYEFLTAAAAFAYIRCWEVIAPAIDAALDSRDAALREAREDNVQLQHDLENALLIAANIAQFADKWGEARSQPATPSPVPIQQQDTDLCAGGLSVSSMPSRGPCPKCGAYIDDLCKFVSSVSPDDHEVGQPSPEIWTEEDIAEADAKAAALHRQLHPEEYPATVAPDSTPPAVTNDPDERSRTRELLSLAERLWRDLENNNLGGYSGINRPFYILSALKDVDAAGHLRGEHAGLKQALARVFEIRDGEGRTVDWCNACNAIQHAIRALLPPSTPEQS